MIAVRKGSCSIELALRRVSFGAVVLEVQCRRGKKVEGFHRQLGGS